MRNLSEKIEIISKIKYKMQTHLYTLNNTDAANYFIKKLREYTVMFSFRVTNF